MVGAPLGRGPLVPPRTEVEHAGVQNRNQAPAGDPGSRPQRTPKVTLPASAAGLSTVRQPPLDGAPAPARRGGCPPPWVRRSPLAGAAAPTRRCGGPHSTVRQPPLDGVTSRAGND